MKLLKKVLSIVLVVCLLSSFASAFSAKAEKASEKGAEFKNDFRAAGTNSVGELLAKDINEAQDKLEENQGNNIFSVTVEENRATVEFQTTQKAYLLIAIYSENKVRMLCSGKEVVDSEETKKVIEIDTDSMPQYFYLKAFLVDTASLKPICSAYETPIYTQEMQELLEKSVDDFSEESVLNLDNNPSNNFMVFNDDVIEILENNTNENHLVMNDDDALRFVFENPDETLQGLVEDDIFYYKIDTENLLIVKVDKIQWEGNTFVVYGKDFEIEEAFDLVKIDTSSLQSQNEITYDESAADDGVSLTNDAPALSSYKPEWEGSNTYSKTVDLKINYSEENENANVTIKGGLRFSLNVFFKYYLSFSNFYIELNAEYSSGISLEISAKVNLFKKTLGEFGYSPLPGVYIMFVPKFVASFDVSITVDFSITGNVGFARVNGNNLNLTSSPVLNAEVKIAGVFFAGFDFEISIGLLGSVVKGAVDITAGLEISVTDTQHIDSNNGIIHECAACLKGEVFFKGSLDIKFSFVNNKKLSYTFNIASWRTKSFDCYYSIDFNEAGIGICPHIKCRTQFHIVDANMQPVSGAVVEIDGIQYLVNDSGIFDEYIRSGAHTIYAYKGEMNSGSLCFEVKDKPISTFIIISDKLSDQFLNQYFLNGSFSSSVLVYEGHVYQLINENFEYFAQAESYCESINGHLAVINGKEEDERVYSYIKSLSCDTAFLGMREKSEGVWEDVFGNELSYFNWAGGEPNNEGGNEDVIHYYYKYSNGKWNDFRWGKQGYYQFICEWESASDYLRYLSSIDMNTGTLNELGFSTVESNPFDNLFNQSKSFSNLIPNETYNFYVLKSSQAQNMFGKANLLYVTQVTSDETGSAQITFRPTVTFNAAEYIMLPMQKEDISFADVSVPSLNYNGEEQYVKPVVKMGEKTLTPGVDYYLSGEWYATEGGYYTVTINGTGAYEGTVDVEYEVHHWDEGVVTKEPTCTGFGTKTFTCSICNNTKNTYIWMLGHNFEFTQTIDPQCEEKGYDLYTCTRCNATTKKNETAVLGHDYQLSSHRDSTCNTAGSDLYICSRCKVEDMRELPRLEGTALEAALQKAAEKLQKNYFTQDSYDNLNTVYLAHKDDLDTLTQQSAVDEAARALEAAIAALELNDSAQGEQDGMHWQWEKESGLLRISGNGEMPDYTKGTAPWADVLSQTAAIEVGEGITSIGAYAFYGAAAVEGVRLPESLEKIGIYAFYECSALRELVVPDSVTYIGNRSFYNCASLTTVQVPASAVYYTYAFYGDEAIEKVHITAGTDGQMPTINYAIEISFLTIAGVFGPCRYAKNAVVEIDEGVTTIGKNSFYNCSGVSKVIVHNYQCVIDDSENTFAPNTVLCAQFESTTKEYAQKYGREFVDINGSSSYYNINSIYSVDLPFGKPSTLILKNDKDIYTFESMDGVFLLNGYIRQGAYDIYVKPLYGISALVQEQVDSLELKDNEIQQSAAPPMGDFNLDGIIDFADVSAFLSVYGNDSLSDDEYLVYDITGDNTVDISDLSQMLLENTYGVAEKIL
ncbi:MAG: leucine-rich repeat protein [Clostridia bacterium]|nr:leucine-rich repeat protein [Clostridia bacterium]